MSKRIKGKRESNQQFYTRGIELKILERGTNPKEENESNRIKVVASTDDPADFGFMRETLVHGEDNIDRDGAVSALLNHDRNQIIGKIVSTEVDGRTMTAELEIDSDVVGSNGLPILRSIRRGYLRGVSIGYDYRGEDAEVSEDENGNRSVVVNRWQLREISITPTPVDLKAGVQRSIPDWLENQSRVSQVRSMEGEEMPFKEWLKKRGFDFDALTEEQRASLKKDFEAEGNRSVEVKQDNFADELAKERAKREEAENAAKKAQVKLELSSLARSHGVEIKDDDFNGKSKAEGLQMILEKKAERASEGNPSGSQVVVQVDAADKANDAAEDALMAIGGVRQDEDLGMRTGSILDIGRRWLAANGRSDVLSMSKHDLSQVLLGSGGGMTRFDRVNGQRSAANVTSGMFTTYLLANTMEKLIYNGFNNFNETTYQIWTNERQVSDFKTFTGGALDAGNLVETTENIAFPELVKGEGGYSSELGLWGATLSLTLQALVNDDLGEFMRTLGRAGAIAKRTIDKEVYTVVNANAFTGRTTGSLALSDANLSTVRTDMVTATGPAGEVLGTTPSFIVVPSALRSTVLGITQVTSYIAPTSVLVNADIQPVITPHLTEDGTAANSAYYLAGNPAIYDTIVVALLAGMTTPVVEEYDAGAVAKRSWKIMQPFKAVAPATMYGMWQGHNT